MHRLSPDKFQLLRNLNPLIILILFYLLSFPLFVFSADLIVKRIEIEGSRRTKTYIIERELLTRPNAPLDENTLQQDELRLRNLGIFSDVWLTYTVEDDSAVVNILVAERLAIVPFPLMSYTELDGWSYGGGIYYKNFSGRNRRLKSFCLFGAAAQYYFGLKDPWIAGYRISLNTEIANIVRDHPYEDFQQTEKYFFAEIGKRWGYQKWGLVKIGIRRVESDITGITLTNYKYDDIPYILLTGIYDSRDLWANPSRGWRLLGKVGQNGIPNQRPDFRYFYFSAAKFLPIEWGRTLGLMASFAEKNGHLPAYERLYFGGVYSVRGLKPNYDRGTRIFLTGMEYRFDILHPTTILSNFDLGLGGTVFLDGGTVWGDGKEFEDAGFHHGFGFGLRLLMPFVEVIRVDVGWTAHTSYCISAAAGAKF